MERAHLSSSRVKLSRFRFFVFTCRKVNNGREVTFWVLLFQYLDKYQTLLAKNPKSYSITYMAPESFWRLIILLAYCNILDWNNKNIFHQIQVVLMISVKYSTNSSRNPPRSWTNSNAVSTFNSSPVAWHNLYIEKFPAWAFRCQLSSFSTNALRLSIKSKIVLPFLVLVVSDYLYWVVEICQQDMPGGK